MKKLLLGLLLLLVVVVAAAVALPFVLPREMIKAQVERRVTAELGRDFAIEGPLTFRPWRPFALTLADVRLANPDWAETPELARIDRVDLEVDALAYLGGAVVIERLIIERPSLALEVREDGTASWEMGDGRRDGGREHGERGGDRVDQMPEIRIGEIRIVDGSVTLADRSRGEARSFTGLELWARGEPGGPALNVDGSVTSAGERATLNAVVGDLDGFLRGEPSSLTLDLAAPGLGVAANGEASPAGNAVLALTADMAPRILLDWVGQPVELPAGSLETVTFTVDMGAASTGVALRAFTLEVDDLTIQGELELVTGERPTLTGRLDLGRLDLRPYLPPRDPGAAAGRPDETATAGPEGWPTEPLDLPLPLPLDIDLEVQLAGLATHELEVGAGRFGLVADRARTVATIAELALYDGSLTGTVTLASGPVLGLDAEVDITGVQLQPLVAAVADLDWLAGTGNVRLAVTSRGDSVDALIRGLDGDGALLARDGAILGINIGATVRQVMTLGTQSAAREPQRTDFAEAGGTFTIAGGVLDNQDFALSAPVLRVTGAGTVDLGEQTLAYRLQPRLASTLEGQDASRDAAFQAGVPLLIQGPWADPAIRLDLGGTLSGDIGDPAALAEAVRGIAGDPAMLETLRDTFGIAPDSPLGGVLGGLGGLLGGGQQQPAPDDPDAPPPAPAQDPAGRLLEGLGGLLRR